MEALLVRSKFHELIDKVENSDLLERFYEAFKSAAGEKSELWNTLSPELQEHINKGYEETLDKKNLIPHDEVKKQFSKWLSK